MKISFKGSILVVGCGGVSQCAVPLLLRLIDCPSDRITIMDFVDNRARVKDALERGVRYVQERITRDNYKTLIKKYLGPGDVMIDLAYDIDACAVLDFCHENGIHYLNTSVELWEPYHGADSKHPTELTLYARQMNIRKLVASWKEPGPTAVVDHGANPGLVSHFTKQALFDIAQKILKEKPKDPRRAELEIALGDRDFPKLAFLTGVKTIHVSERDTQITNKPKEENEFVNTWSIIGLIEEGIAPSELGWGTHERRIPEGAMSHTTGPRNQICLPQKGMKTWARSWVPCGEITGMVIRHGEAFSISDYLTVWDGDRAVYRPTVHYVYCPCDSTVNSMHELEMRRLVPQERQRVMSDEITKGRDELGCLLMGHDFKSWWIGSLLDIEETRRLVPGQNATTLQVAASAVAAVIWMIQNPRKGFCLPDQVDHEAILNVSKPFLGPFVSRPVDWSPLMQSSRYRDYNTQPPRPEDEWQFSSFVVTPLNFESIPDAVDEKTRARR